MIRKLIIGIGGFLSLLAILWYLGYFEAPTQLESLIPNAEVIEAEPSAESWALFDMETGEVIRGENQFAVLPIASITKLFTAYAADASGSLEQRTQINWNDLYTEGRAGKLRHGERLSVRELLFPMLLESSNDAGAVVGRVLGEARAEELQTLRSSLSLANTNIVDATGLSPQNVSNAAELARFFSYLKENHPLITDITTLRMHIDERRGLVNNDPARNVHGFAGGKHGFLPEAGKTFVGSFEIGGGSEVGIVLLGSEDLKDDITAVLEYARKLSVKPSLL